jgi:hypothetical protein
MKRKCNNSRNSSASLCHKCSVLEHICKIPDCIVQIDTEYGYNLLCTHHAILSNKFYSPVQLQQV